MHQVNIYTDGSCSQNPGPGGWCAILCSGGRELVVSGYMPETTNNRMELFAVIEGVSQLKKPCAVNVFSDSSYVVNAFTERWINGWVAKNWKNVKNDDLWRLLLQVIEPHEITFNWVKGHADNEYNNRCDEIACAETKKYIKLHKND
jgi:ribonuclease HI